MVATREERFEGAMYDLRRVLDGVTRYNAEEEQGGIVCSLTPTLTLHVQCFAQLKRWRGMLMSGELVLEEWLTKDRPIWNVVPPARVGLHHAIGAVLDVHFMGAGRGEVLAKLYPHDPERAAELRLARLAEDLVSRWMACAQQATGLLPLEELATMQVYFASMPEHPLFGGFGSIQADTLDNSDNECSSAWDECYAIARRLAVDLGAAVPPSPPWP